jgi:pyridoxamine 5'-phosphate oxidase
MSQDTDPSDQLEQWLSESRAAGERLPEAVALATTRPDGTPAVRMVIVRGTRPELVFFTDYESDKGEELRHDPRAAVLFHWHLPLHRQVRVSGLTSRVGEAEADRYWSRRTSEARRAAAASHQSRVIPDRETIEQRVGELEQRYGDQVPRPERWGGYLLRPQIVEFWQEGPDLLHDRFRYRLVGMAWQRERLSP